MSIPLIVRGLCVACICLPCVCSAQTVAQTTDGAKGGSSPASPETTWASAAAHAKPLTLQAIVTAKSHEIITVKLDQTAGWIWHKKGYKWDPYLSASPDGWEQFSMPVLIAAKKMPKERQQVVLDVIKQAMRECGIPAARVKFEGVTARIPSPDGVGFGVKGSTKVMRVEVLRLKENSAKANTAKGSQNQHAPNANWSFYQYRSWMVSRLPYAGLQGIQAHLLSSLFFTAWHKLYVPAPDEMPAAVQAWTVESDQTKIPTVMIGGYLSSALKRNATATCKELMRLLKIPKSKVVFQDYNVDQGKSDKGRQSQERSRVISIK